MGVEARLVHDQLEQTREASIRRALLLSLGEYPIEQLPRSSQTEWSRLVLSLYCSDPDAGVHSAAEWLLRRWGFGSQIKSITQRLLRGLVAQRDWCVTGEGHTLVVIRQPDEITVGSPESEAPLRLEETQRRVRPMPFAIATKETTLGQFRCFRRKHGLGDKRAEAEDCPVDSVSFFEAARYCNWLSKREGLPPEQWCYHEIGPQVDAITPHPDYLKRTGYRLPTEEEWEYACRAGSTTARFFGGADDLLSRYAWWSATSDNKGHPVGQLKPNDLGLFDVLGNVQEWCSCAGKEGRQDPQACRGGSSVSEGANLRSAYRYTRTPAQGVPRVGFRVARSLGTGR
jgi:hypothetical protein